MKPFQKTLKAVMSSYSDSRVNLCELTGEYRSGKITLTGRVLDQKILQEVKVELRSVYPGAGITSRGVKVLRKKDPVLFTVATNLTSLHKSTSFGAEQMDQMVFGCQVEILQTDGNWVFVRQMDGYLGWTYLPYLHNKPAPAPNHITLFPSVALTDTPSINSYPVTHLMAGTPVQVIEVRDGWGRVEANQNGWLPMSTLRAMDDLPSTRETRQRALPIDATRMVGTPYLWGGVSGGGIDCSGLSRLLHKWVGLEIPRDADMQANAGKPVEPPFQVGDLLFFGEKNESPNITHVAISLGGWKVIHSSRMRNGVYIDNVQEVHLLRDSYLQSATFIDQ